MNDFILKLLVFIAGVALGVLFFLGLWFTVKKALNSKRPVVWFLGSAIIRLSITLLGFYYLTMGNWINMIICLLGFILARFIVLNITKIKDEKSIEFKKGH